MNQHLGAFILNVSDKDKELLRVSKRVDKAEKALRLSKKKKEVRSPSALTPLFLPVAHLLTHPLGA